MRSSVQTFATVGRLSCPRKGRGISTGARSGISPSSRITSTELSATAGGFSRSRTTENRMSTITRTVSATPASRPIRNFNMMFELCAAEDEVHPAAHVPKVCFFTAFQLHRGGAVKSRLGQRAVHFLPVDLAVSQVGKGRAPVGETEVFQVQFHDA